MRGATTISLTALLAALAAPAGVGCDRRDTPADSLRLEAPFRSLQSLQPIVPAAPAPTPAQTAPAAAEQPQQKTYTVTKGDTLWSIAKTSLGDGHRWRDIVAANPGLEAKSLKVGQTLFIPDIPEK